MSKLSVSSSFFLPVHSAGEQQKARRSSDALFMMSGVGGVLCVQTRSNLIGQFSVDLRMRGVPWKLEKVFCLQQQFCSSTSSSKANFESLNCNVAYCDSPLLC